jgi:hypothetical protein
MGKLFSSLASLVKEPFHLQFPHLFGGLVRAIQCQEEGCAELNLQAIRTAGLLGENTRYSQSFEMNFYN